MVDSSVQYRNYGFSFSQCITKVWISFIIICSVVVDGFSVQSSSSSPLSDSYFRVATKIPEDVAKKPLPSFTLAGKIETAIVEKFGAKGTKRVLESLRWLENDYEHCQFMGEEKEEEISKEESNCWQYANSYIRDLTCTPFWDISKFDWAKSLQRYYPEIKKEFTHVMNNQESLKQRGNNIWAGALTEEAGSYGTGWKTLVLLDKGIWDSTNCNLFPQTAKAVQASGIPATEVFFASMQPKSDIKLHSDFANFVLTCHLAIDIPNNGQNKCRLTIGDTTKQWINGDVLLFDTSLMHDAINEADQTRYILMFRIWHPDLTTIETQALQYIWDCLAMPNLLSDNLGDKFMAEQRAATLKSFPTITTTTTNNNNNNDHQQGFGGGTKKSKQKNKKSKMKSKGGKSKGFGA